MKHGQDLPVAVEKGEEGGGGVGGGGGRGGGGGGGGGGGRGHVGMLSPSRRRWVL